MTANLVWNIHVFCDAKPMGEAIKVTGWDVLSKLAAIKAALPDGWSADAFPEV